VAEDPVRIRPVSQDMDVPPLLKAVPEAVEGVADGRVCYGKALGQVLEEPVLILPVLNTLKFTLSL